MKKTAIVLIIIIPFIFNITLAGDRFFGGGAGGFEMIYLPLDLTEIDNRLNDVGLSELESALYLKGGGGWGNIGNNIRIGGYGYGGAIPAISSKDGQMAREFNLEIGLGGFAIEKAFKPLHNSEVNLRCILGAGTMDISIEKWSKFTSWDNLWEDYDPENNNDSPVAYSSKVKTEFFMAAPSLGIRYYVLDWFAIGANVGYLYTNMKKDKWKINGEKLYEVPDIDLSNTIYKINFFFGG